MVLKTLEAKGQRQGQKWVTAANVLGWKEGVSRGDCRWVGEGCSLLRMCGEVVRCVRGGLAKV